jgi:alkanesulfonate monooxygenase SsuD/methylene tetrahydromethanopterin reductase-like flavin-dependent oxidoreductase (luciferase family)
MIPAQDPRRDPVEVAKMLAGIAVLSNDRLAVGVGVGWMKEEFEALGADFESRGRITDEWIAILRHLWDGSREGFTGTFYRFDPLGFAPRPGHIPIIVGGNSAPAMRRAARHDGWHAIRIEPEDLARRVLEGEERPQPPTLAHNLRTSRCKRVQIVPNAAIPPRPTRIPGIRWRTRKPPD